MSAFADHIHSGETIIVAGEIGDQWTRHLSFRDMRTACLVVLVDVTRRMVDVHKDRGGCDVLSDHMAAMIEQFQSLASRDPTNDDVRLPDDDDLVLLRLFARN